MRLAGMGCGPVGSGLWAEVGVLAGCLLQGLVPQARALRQVLEWTCAERRGNAWRRPGGFWSRYFREGLQIDGWMLDVNRKWQVKQSACSAAAQCILKSITSFRMCVEEGSISGSPAYTTTCGLRPYTATPLHWPSEFAQKDPQTAPRYIVWWVSTISFTSPYYHISCCPPQPAGEPSPGNAPHFGSVPRCKRREPGRCSMNSCGCTAMLRTRSRSYRAVNH